METIQLNGKTFEFKTKTGKVLGTNKNMETRVSGGGGGGFSNRGTGYTAPVSITSSTTIHDQIFLEDSSGKEHAFQLSDFNVACREGNNLTVVSMFKANAKKGYYVAVINHSTDKYYFDEGMINDIVKPNKWLLIGIVLLLTLLSIKMLGGSAFVFGLFVAIAAFIYFSVMTNKNRKLVIAKIQNMNIQ